MLMGVLGCNRLPEGQSGCKWIGNKCDLKELVCSGAHVCMEHARHALRLLGSCHRRAASLGPHICIRVSTPQENHALQLTGCVRFSLSEQIIIWRACSDSGIAVMSRRATLQH